MSYHPKYHIDKPRKTEKQLFCEHCGGTEPWASDDWVEVGRFVFCCQWCVDMYYESVLRVQIRMTLKRGGFNKKHD